MGILTTMFSAVSGLNTYGNAMSVIGNNIANVGTVGFKSSHASFADLVSASLGGGSSAGQVGLGVFLNDVQTSFTQGSLSNTGNTLDLAIDGNGFFQLRDNAGTVSYSRAGQFEVNNLGEIVDPSGRFLQGYQATATGVVLGTVGNIALSTATVAPQATSTATVEANLDSAATVPAAAFDVTDATTYNFSNGITVYDTLGAQHQLRMYYVKDAVANTWNLHSQIDGGAATAQANLVFNSSGVLTGRWRADIFVAYHRRGGHATECGHGFFSHHAVWGCIELDRPNSRWVHLRVVSECVDRFGRASRGAVYQRSNENPCPNRSGPIHESEWTDTLR